MAGRILSTALLLVSATVVSASEWNWSLPAGFPRPVVPADNPMSSARVELGRHLFYDKRLSGNRRQACATCHRQELAFTDGRARSEGSTRLLHPRSSMTLVNVAYAPRLTWAHPTLDSLEEQMLIPMLGQAPVEMGMKGNEAKVLKALRNDPVYCRLFAEAFSEPDAVTLINIGKALACFERSIVSARSPYDRYRWGGETDALSDAAKRGEKLFFSGEHAGCFQCHGGWNFSAVRFAGEPLDTMSNPVFFNTGVSAYAQPNRGLMEYTRIPQDLGRFKAPTLRNIAVTAPYMHDGSIATLGEVIDHYAKGGRFPSRNKSPVLRPFQLTVGEKSDLIEFLKSLTDPAMLQDTRWNDPWPSRDSPGTPASHGMQAHRSP